MMRAFRVMERVPAWRAVASPDQRQRLARIEPAVVERPAGDRAGEAGAIGFGEPPDVLDRGEAARGDHRNRQRLGERDRACNIESGQRAVARNSV